MLGALVLAAGIACGGASASAGPHRMLPFNGCQPSAGYALPECNFPWFAGDGVHAGTPVLDTSGERVGYLHYGANAAVCWASGPSVSIFWPGMSSDIWLLTAADNGSPGWVSWAFGAWGYGGPHWTFTESDVPGILQLSQCGPGAYPPGTGHSFTAARFAPKVVSRTRSLAALRRARALRTRCSDAMAGICEVSLAVRHHRHAWVTVGRGHATLGRRTRHTVVVRLERRTVKRLAKLHRVVMRLQARVSSQGHVKSSRRIVLYKEPRRQRARAG